MTDIRPLTGFDRARFVTLAGGYASAEMYRVARQEADAQTTFTLALESLPQPHTYTFPYSPEELDRYDALPAEGFCLGAYDGEVWIGVALGEPHHWNNTLWVWEFHIDAAFHGQGVGRRLMDALAERATAAGFRALVCETQNTNVPAIRFYRSVGFLLAGVDVAYYTNDDTQPGRTVAIFMKRFLMGSGQ